VLLLVKRQVYHPVVPNRLVVTPNHLVVIPNHLVVRSQVMMIKKIKLLLLLQVNNFIR
jgi:hypothetical protein